MTPHFKGPSKVSPYFIPTVIANLAVGQVTMALNWVESPRVAPPRAGAGSPSGASSASATLVTQATPAGGLPNGSATLLVEGTGAAELGGLSLGMGGPAPGGSLGLL
jgi:hypothetical protein